jgi:hypothetical protein
VPFRRLNSQAVKPKLFNWQRLWQGAEPGPAGVQQMLPYVLLCAHQYRLTLTAAFISTFIILNLA